MSLEFNKIDLLKKYLKLVLGNPSYRTTLRMINSSSPSRRAIIIGTPVHGNLGDHLIAIESLKFVKNLNLYDEIIEVPEFLYELFGKKMHLSSMDTIFIVGGGWMGNIYEDEFVIEDIITQWKENRIIILPQTIFFDKERNYEHSLSRAKNIFTKAYCSLVCVREEYSYDVALKELKIPEENLFHTPDIALLHPTYAGNGRRTGILFSLREDNERQIDDYNFQKLQDELSKRKINCRKTSTVIDKKVVKIKQREKEIDLKLDEFSKAELIVTDRLHTMIMAILAGTKCIILDNKTKKVSGVYQNWLVDNTLITYINSPHSLTCDFVCNIYNKNTLPVYKDFSEYFSGVEKKIKEQF